MKSIQEQLDELKAEFEAYKQSGHWGRRDVLKATGVGLLAMIGASGLAAADTTITGTTVSTGTLTESTRTYPNILSALTPTFSNWAVNPGTNANLTSELNPTLTTPGQISGTTTATITFDLTTSRRIIAQTYGPYGNDDMYIYGSDDNSNYYPWAVNTIAGGNVNTKSGSICAVGKARYLRFSRYNPTSGTDTISSISLRAYEL